jgi:hypothetical protein
MKTKSCVLAILLLLACNCKSQINFEHSYPATSYLSVINLSSSGYKYLLSDYSNNTVKLYNLNHSLWKSITLDIPAGYTLASTSAFSNISEELFNTDALLELSYTYYQTTPTYYYETKIINENGTVLLTISNCGMAYAVNTGTNGWKLRATIFDSSGTFTSNDVYSLVGTMPLMLAESGINNIDVLSNPYPNPSQTSTKINYQLPTGTNSAEIIFYNLNGLEVKRFKVDNTFNTLELNNSDLIAGTYLYLLVTSNNFSSAKQMVVIK